ncbi:DUF1653 domain-containing protein [Chroococcidiopsis sp.]|uniref:DUF1653 domain-containing protein n=1 Tax=Chroococcidiopsis sp. TaxID=3088168 RepID=UPI003F3615C5
MTYQVKPVIRLGYYKHFKGAVYRLKCLAQDSETLEWLIVYGNVHGDWVRTADNFLDLINHEGKTVPRFEFLGEEKP